MIMKHKLEIWYMHIHIHMKINMLHIKLINFPFAQRVSEFLISPRNREVGRRARSESAPGVWN